jgi:hypothetical protein
VRGIDRAYGHVFTARVKGPQYPWPYRSRRDKGGELVNRAGASLTEIVESIKKVAAIVSDIAAASAEQSTDIDQINVALTQRRLAGRRTASATRCYDQPPREYCSRLNCMDACRQRKRGQKIRAQYNEICQRIHHLPKL